MPPVRNLSDTGLRPFHDSRKATALVTKVCLIIGPCLDDSPAGLYVIQKGGDGLGGVEFFGRAPHALAGFEIVLVLLFSLSFEALLLRRRLRRGQAFWDERGHGHGRRASNNTSSGHARIAARSSASHLVRKAVWVAGSTSPRTRSAASRSSYTARVAFTSSPSRTFSRASLARSRSLRSALVMRFFLDHADKRGLVAESAALKHLKGPCAPPVWK